MLLRRKYLTVLNVIKKRNVLGADFVKFAATRKLTYKQSGANFAFFIQLQMYQYSQQI